MAKHIVKCLYCKKDFDANQEEYVKPRANRYAHKECAKKEELRQKTLEQIHEKMQHILGVNYSSQKINKQIKKFLEEGKTEVGILQTLEYWYDIKKNTPEKANGGIAIVDWVYGEAMNYFYNKRQYQNINNNAPDYANYLQETKTLVFKPKPIQKPKGVKLFNLK